MYFLNSSGVHKFWTYAFSCVAQSCQTMSLYLPGARLELIFQEFPPHDVVHYNAAMLRLFRSVAKQDQSELSCHERWNNEDNRCWYVTGYLNRVLSCSCWESLVGT